MPKIYRNSSQNDFISLIKNKKTLNLKREGTAAMKQIKTLINKNKFSYFFLFQRMKWEEQYFYSLLNETKKTFL